MRPSSTSPRARAGRYGSSSASTPRRRTSTSAIPSCSTSCASSRMPVTSRSSSSATTRRASATPRDAARRVHGSTARSSTPTRRPTKEQAFLILDDDPAKLEVRVQRRVAGDAHHGAALRAHGDDHGGAHSRARRLRQALGRSPAHHDARDALPAGPGLRLGGRARRHRAGRHRSGLQPLHGSRPAGVLRAAAAGAHDDRRSCPARTGSSA